jgi:hypothetical protein
MEHVTKWQDAYAIPKQQASMVAEALDTTYFCRCRVHLELHSDQGRNCEFRLMQEVL